MRVLIVVISAIENHLRPPDPASAEFPDFVIPVTSVIFLMTYLRMIARSNETAIAVIA